ncbi:MAG: site-2 protease family protein [Myxococcota bacterium]
MTGTCTSCGAPLHEGALVCSRCHALVHRQRLEEIAARASATEDPSEALALWREAIDLLPDESRQHAAIMEKIRALSEEVDAPKPKPKPSWAAKGGAIGTAALAVLGIGWKLKSVLFLVAGKAKLLLMGFSKIGTVLSMFSTMGVYALLWGWKFAVGFVLCIYVHEIGHVAALRRYGIPASAPMFIPGFGAFVRLKQYPASRREDARTGIAGPLWGTGAALACLLVGTVSGSQLFVALAKTAAWLNLFNLAPVGSLDGGRAFRAMTRVQRFGVAGLVLVGGLVAGDGLAILLALVAGGVAWFGKDVPEEGDLYTAVVFALLGGGLPLLAGLHVATP